MVDCLIRLIERHSKNFMTRRMIARCIHLTTFLLQGGKDNELDDNQIVSTLCKYGVIKFKNN